jgi:hypothetical protein
LQRQRLNYPRHPRDTLGPDKTSVPLAIAACDGTTARPAPTASRSSGPRKPTTSGVEKASTIATHPFGPSVGPFSPMMGITTAPSLTYAAYTASTGPAWGKLAFECGVANATVLLFGVFAASRGVVGWLTYARTTLAPHSGFSSRMVLTLTRQGARRGVGLA